MSTRTFLGNLELGSGSFVIPSPAERPLAYIVTAFMFLLVIYNTTSQKKANVPELNPPKSRVRLPGYVSAEQAQDFTRNSKDLMVAGRAKYPDQAYRLYSYLGDAIIIPPNLVNEIRNEHSLDFQASSSIDFHGHISGFEAFTANEKLPRYRYYQASDKSTECVSNSFPPYKLTKPLPNEASLVLSEKFGESKTEWHSIHPSSDILRIVARLSTRIFLGEELCRNDKWLDASAVYAKVAFHAVEVLRRYPEALRPWVASFVPEVRAARQCMADCREIMSPFVARRKAAKAEAVARGEEPPRYDDSLEWFEKENGANFDPTRAQIGLSLVAIHTTSDLLQEVMIRITQRPELFQVLRKEIVEVLGRDGLKKTALYNLKIMDSVIKEAQRLKTNSLLGMMRRATKDLTLSNGLTIPKGERVWVDTTHMLSEHTWENATDFDPYRFVNLRGTERDHVAHLVSTSAEHVGFGHGQHACPGRFFAANELKILLCHMVLKYDWRVPEGQSTDFYHYGLSLVPNQEMRILVRRRGEQETDLESLAC